jgi:hypothetical protein
MEIYENFAIVLGILKTTKLVFALGLINNYALVYTKTYLIFIYLLPLFTPFFSFWLPNFSLSKFGQLNLRKSFAA